ncbi:histidine phosphatase family protein [Allokutzneria sp. NRRL B-24872]|uniref:histidine phosphatase family protein n=1 Tax=Allokutzneria sp. NRRL B-24872 TaxID=1137961 RepID=UPI000A3A99DB|nr:histidine phosphatase family protein [Allokutzneria sp. NRRL B-24872]
MATVILLRHARSTANGAGVLAGRTPGVGLAERGEEQARELVDRLAGVPVAGLVRSPLHRCVQTLEPLSAKLGLTAVEEPRLSEVDYGEWTGRGIKDLVEEPLWKVVQQHPSAAVFPGGEGLAEVQARAVAAIREHDARMTAEHGENAVWIACSHGDVIKAVLADALGLHLDSFQRIVVEPCSMSVVTYTETRPYVLRVNDTGGDLSSLVPRADAAAMATAHAAVGGSTA